MKNSHNNMPDSINVSCGDIIFRTTSFIIADSKCPTKGFLPGHVGIFMSDTTISTSDNELKNILIAEISAFNRKKKKIARILTIHTADNNYANAKGRLFIVKTCLSDTQKQKLLKYTESTIGKPYKLFARKNDTTIFNCSSFVWNAFKYSADIDIDTDGGKFVFPADIFKYFKNKTDFEILRF